MDTPRSPRPLAAGPARVASAVLARLGPDGAFTAGSVLFALVFAWFFTAPRFVALINWDNGGYIAAIASGKLGWSAMPWNNHLGVGQEYLIGSWIARAFGGTVIDGFRLVGAVAFAIAFWAIADTLRILTRQYALSALLTLAWATAWVNFHYHLIVEDNFLFLAPAAVMLRLCVLRADRWRWWHSVASGALVMVAFLGSWQGLPYLAPAMWAALLAGGRPRGVRGAAVRARDALLVPAAFVGSLLLWMAFFVATSSLTWKALSPIVFSRPEPSFLPRTLPELAHVVTSGTLLDTLGIGVAYHISFSAYKLSTTLPLSMARLGLIALLFQIALFVVCTVWSWRRRDLRPHLLAGMLLLFTVVTALHRDQAAYAMLKRFDFVPLYLVLLAGVALAAVRLDPWLRRALPAVLGVIIVLQTALGLRWSFRELATYRTTRPWAELPQPAHQLYGRDGRSWYAYFRALRKAHPEACRFVFVVTEFNSGWWNQDLIGALWSELPDHLTVEHPAIPIERPLWSWRHAPKFLPLAEARKQGLLDGCAWLSEDARRLVGPAAPEAP